MHVLEKVWTDQIIKFKRDEWKLTDNAIVVMYCLVRPDRDLAYLHGYPTSFMFPLVRAMVEQNFSTALSTISLSVLN